MRRSRWMLSAAIALGALAGAAHAEQDTVVQYVGAAPALNAYCSSCAGTAYNVGGVRIPAILAVPRTVAFRDASGGPVHYAIGQDIVGNNRIGDLYEPFLTGCGTSVDLSSSAERFEADEDLIVQVLQPDPLAPCGKPVAGSIAVVYA